MHAAKDRKWKEWKTDLVEFVEQDDTEEVKKRLRQRIRRSPDGDDTTKKQKWMHCPLPTFSFLQLAKKVKFGNPPCLNPQDPLTIGMSYLSNNG